MKNEARNFLVKEWNEAGEKVIAECAKVEPFNRSMEDFLSHCTACGGNWGGMLLTGIKELFPAVWDAIPDSMGMFAFTCLCYVLQLCGVEVNKV